MLIEELICHIIQELVLNSGLICIATQQNLDDFFMIIDISMSISISNVSIIPNHE